jgi:carboxymethylenebutenolidase
LAINPLSRREVMKFGAFTTVGGVLTPGISLAQAIATDTRGILARDIELNVGGTKIPAYDARPERQGQQPIVVAISGFTGLTEQHKDVVRRFAHAGYYAIAPELFFREGLMFGKAQPELAKISASIGRKQYLGDIRAAADFAKSQPWARPDRLGVDGLLRRRRAHPAFFRGESGRHGRGAVVRACQAHLQRRAGCGRLRHCAQNQGAALGLYGDADQGIPTADVKAFEAELKKTNPNVEFILYPGAPHAFFSDDRPQVYRKDASEDAWKRCVAFFDRHLKA